MPELDKFMDYCYKTDVEVAIDRLKESAKHNESMLHYWKVVKKRRERDAKKAKVKRVSKIMKVFREMKRESEFLKYVVYGECKVVL